MLLYHLSLVFLLMTIIVFFVLVCIFLFFGLKNLNLNPDKENEGFLTLFCSFWIAYLIWVVSCILSYFYFL